LEVENKGERASAEVVQLYLQSVVSSVSRPVKELRGFAKVALQPGETKTCAFNLKTQDLEIYDKELHRVVEPGDYRVLIGASSEDIRAHGEFRVKEAR